MMPLLDRHPNAVLPFKAAAAAAIAWVVVQPVGGFIADYQYYAPLGAVVTVTPAVVRGAQSAVHAVLAILAGGLLAIAVDALPLPQPVAIAVAVAAGVACSYSRHLGNMGSWVPFVALFALVLHGHHPWHYVIAYVLLAGVGGLVGLLVAFLLPQVPTGPATRAGRRLSEELAHALTELAEAIRTSASLGEKWREELRASLGDRSQGLRDAVRDIGAARRANWRARSTTTPAERLQDRARTLQRLADAVAHVLEIADATILATDGRTPAGRLPSPLRLSIVDALCRAAEPLREGFPVASQTWSGPDHRALRRLREEMADDGIHLGGEVRLALIGMTAALERLAEHQDQ